MFCILSLQGINEYIKETEKKTNVGIRKIPEVQSYTILAFDQIKK